MLWMCFVFVFRETVTCASFSDLFVFAAFATDDGESSLWGSVLLLNKLLRARRFTPRDCVIETERGSVLRFHFDDLKTREAVRPRARESRIRDPFSRTNPCEC